METNYTTTAFTVDLSQLGFGNTSTITNTNDPLVGLPPDLTRMPLMVRGTLEYVDISDLVKPGGKYHVFDCEGDDLGYIGMTDEIVDINSDDQCGVKDPTWEVDSSEEMDEAERGIKRALALLSITTPNKTDPHPHRSNVETLTEWLDAVPRYRAEILEEERANEEDEEAEKNSCTGDFDRRTGEIDHDRWCPIHLSN